MSCSKEARYKLQVREYNFSRKMYPAELSCYTLIKVTGKICKARDHASRTTKSSFSLLSQNLKDTCLLSSFFYLYLTAWIRASK